MVGRYSRAHVNAAGCRGADSANERTTSFFEGASRTSMRACSVKTFRTMGIPKDNPGDKPPLPVAPHDIAHIDRVRADIGEEAPGHEGEVDRQVEIVVELKHAAEDERHQECKHGARREPGQLCRPDRHREVAAQHAERGCARGFHSG